MKVRKLILIFSLAILGCGKTNTTLDTGGGGNGGGTGTQTITPGKSILLFPAQNSVCTTGTSVSSTQTSVTFTWNASENTDSYELDIENLLTKAITTQTYTATSTTVTLLNATPYAWTIISKTSKNTSSVTSSDVWKFYVSGPGVVYYAPFPATIVSPVFNQTVTASNGMTNLTWLGSDPDNDIKNYDIYLGTSSTNLTLYKAGVTDMFLNAVPVSSTTYYWKVLTNDSKGNITDSGVYQFTVR